MFERFFSGLLPYDHLVIVYSWIIIVITVNLVRPIEYYLGVVAFHLGAIAVAGLLSHFVKPGSPRIALFFRLLYPFILMTFFYQFSGELVGAVVPGINDHHIVTLEKSLFGVNPTLWLDQHPDTFLTELMSAGYLSYYLMIPGLALLLFFTRRDAEIRRFVTAGCVTFFASYLFFILYPVVGPRYYFEGLYQHTLTGPILRPLVMFVIDNAAFRGGAMPSSHVAVAVVVLFFAVRSFRKKGWLLAPAVAALAMGTVYGRFHYVTDVIAGVLMGVIIPWLTLMFYPAKRDYSRIWDLSDFDRKGRHVPNSV